jgi:hypothetical protein
MTSDAPCPCCGRALRANESALFQNGQTYHVECGMAARRRELQLLSLTPSGSDEAAAAPTPSQDGQNLPSEGAEQRRAAD